MISAYFVSAFVLTCLALVTPATLSPCVTPLGDNGRCVPVQLCGNILQYTKQYRSYLEQARCFIEDRAELHICCDSAEANKPLASHQQLDSFESNLNARGLQILREQNCGKLNGDRVAHGEDAHLGEFPWMALLKYDAPAGQEFQCGGALITNRYVLTAAHCVVNTPQTLIGVRLGEHDLRKGVDCQGKSRRRRCQIAEDFGVESTFYHDSYTGSKAYDVGLIKLARQVDFSRSIKPVCMPTFANVSHLQANEMLYVAGWGLTESGNTASILQKTFLRYSDPDICQKEYMLSFRSDSHICIGGDSDVTTCKGDSGGPVFALVPYNRATSYRVVQYGIISHGGACGINNGILGLHTNVVGVMPWITKQIVSA